MQTFDGDLLNVFMGSKNVTPQQPGKGCDDSTAVPSYDATIVALTKRIADCECEKQKKILEIQLQKELQVSLNRHVRIMYAYTLTHTHTHTHKHTTRTQTTDTHKQTHSLP